MVGKRDKYENLEKAAKEMAEKRKLAVDAGNEKVYQLRTRLEQDEKNLGRPDGSTKTAQVQLAIELDDINHARLSTIWPRVLDEKNKILRKEADELRRSNEELVRILEGYAKHYNMLVGDDAVLNVMKHFTESSTTNHNEDVVTGGCDHLNDEATTTPMEE